MLKQVTHTHTHTYIYIHTHTHTHTHTHELCIEADICWTFSNERYITNSSVITVNCCGKEININFYFVLKYRVCVCVCACLRVRVYLPRCKVMYSAVSVIRIKYMTGLLPIDDDFDDDDDDIDYDDSVLTART